MAYTLTRRSRGYTNKRIAIRIRLKWQISFFIDASTGGCLCCPVSIVSPVAMRTLWASRYLLT